MNKILVSLLWLAAVAVPAVVSAQDNDVATDATRSERKALQEDREWVPTGQWPFLNRRFQTAEVVTGLVTAKKTVVPCNIHIGKQTLWYVQKDSLMEADGSNVRRVTFSNGDVYQPISADAFAKVVREDSIGRVLLVQTVDDEKFRKSANDASHLSSFSLGGDFGMLNIDLISQYVGNPEEQPLPVLNTFYFVYNREIFEVTDKNILPRINQARRKEYRAFTRSAEIITRNESSVLKIWKEFFLKR